jgi:hypothetical protein
LNAVLCALCGGPLFLSMWGFGHAPTDEGVLPGRPAQGHFFLKRHNSEAWDTLSGRRGGFPAPKWRVRKISLDTEKLFFYHLNLPRITRKGIDGRTLLGSDVRRSCRPRHALTGLNLISMNQNRDNQEEEKS